MTIERITSFSINGNTPMPEEETISILRAMFHGNNGKMFKDNFTETNNFECSPWVYIHNEDTLKYFVALASCHDCGEQQTAQMDSCGLYHFDEENQIYQLVYRRLF